ncbi:methyltransferase [Aureococcus anophagefferens]|nr:methyltransferase [Aureococcus anophagefferens]
MVNDGYANVRCVDNCAVVVEQMSAKYGALGGLTFGATTRGRRGVADGSVDCVVDKGTLDAVLCGEDSREGSAQLLAAALRVLKKKGVLLIVSHSKARAALIPPGAWKVATHDVAAPALDDAKPATTHYVYACTKIA